MRASAGAGQFRGEVEGGQGSLPSIAKPPGSQGCTPLPVLWASDGQVLPAETGGPPTAQTEEPARAVLPRRGAAAQLLSAGHRGAALLGPKGVQPALPLSSASTWDSALSLLQAQKVSCVKSGVRTASFYHRNSQRETKPSCLPTLTATEFCTEVGFLGFVF